MIGREIGQYRILEKLGQGAMGVVYKAEDQSLLRPVALKFLPPHMVSSQGARDRLVQEARAAAALRHEAICTVYETGTAGDDAFIAMEFCDGETLENRLERGALGVEEALDLMTRVARGLDHAHKGGVIHRDLKPGNIMMVPDRGPVLMDFGLARREATTRLTVAGTAMGTANYMSPEQANGQDVDHRTDIWACGVMLYEMLAGDVPFKGEFGPAVVYSILNQDPEPLAKVNTSVPYGLEMIVDRCLEKDPDKRFQSAGELADELTALRGEIAQGRGKGKFLGIRRLFRRPRTLAAVAAVMLLVVAASVFTINALREQPIDSLAVLPFADLSGMENQEFFAEGLTEQLITELQMLGARSDLRVIGRTSVMKYRHTEMSLPEIAAELDVDAVVEASIRRSGDEVFLTAKLIKAHPERQIWADKFQRSESDILKLNTQLAGTIVRELSLEVDVAGQRHLARAETIDPKAYQAFLQGMYLYNLTTTNSVRKAVALYEEAITLEPGFAPAHAHLAIALEMLTQLAPLPPGEVYERSKEAALAALEIDDTNAEAHAILADILKTGPEWDYEGAERHLSRAMELDPNNPTVLLYQHQFLLDRGRADEGFLLLEKALKADPFNPFLNANLVFASVFSGDLEQARLNYERTLDLDPANCVARWGMGMALLENGQYEEAADILEEACDIIFSEEDGSPEMLPQRLRALVALDRREEIQSVAAEIHAAARRRYIPSIFFAYLEGAQGHVEKAMEYAEASWEENDFRLFWFLDDLQALIFADAAPSQRFLELRARIEAKAS